METHGLDPLTLHQSSIMTYPGSVAWLSSLERDGVKFRLGRETVSPSTSDRST